MKLAGIQLDSCLMNASGVNCTTINELKELESSSVGAIVTKSCTIEYRQGNPEPRYYYSPQQFCSINSTGLHNYGLEYYLNYASLRNSRTLFCAMKASSEAS